MQIWPRKKQWIALVAGMLVWGVCQTQFGESITGQYAYMFGFPLAIGLAIGLTNASEAIVPILLLSLAMGAGNLVYQTAAGYKPWNPSDLAQVAAFMLDCFFSAFVVTQSKRVATLSKRLQTAKPQLRIEAIQTDGGAAPDDLMTRWTKFLPAITALLSAITALITAVGSLLRKPPPH